MEDGFEGLEPLPTGNIYSIEIGQPKNGFKYSVGQKFPFGKGAERDTIEVVEILRDDNSYYLTGVVRYIIYCTLNGNVDSVFSWKYYDNVPVSVTCFAK